MIKKIPIWAPNSLCDLYISLNKELEEYDDLTHQKINFRESRDTKKSRVELLERLIKKPRMESAWKSLTKRFDDITREPQTFFYTVEEALTGPVSDWEHLTDNEKSNRIAKVKKKANELSDLLEQSPFVAEDFFPENYWEDSFKDLFNPNDTFYLHQLIRIKRNHQRNLDIGDPIETIVGNKELSALLGIEVTINPLSEILRNFSDHLEHKLSFQMILKRPNNKNARRLFFIRYIGKYMHSRYGKYLYGVIANVASTALEDEIIGEEIVRNSLLKKSSL